MLQNSKKNGLLKVRGLKADHLAEIEQLATLCNSYEGLDIRLNRDMLRKRPKNETNDFLYYEDGHLVGFLALFSFNSREGEVSGMVHPEYRRRGIATTLFATVCEECRRRRMAKILLIIEHHSRSGQAFVRSLEAGYDHSEYKMVLGEARLPVRWSKLLQMRRAKAEDLAAISHITAVAFEMDEGEVNWYTEKGLENEQRRYYVALLDTVVMGKIDVALNAKDAMIFGFGVLPEYRGKGYGRQILAWTLQEILATGQQHIALEVVTENRRALSLYQSCGFEETNRYDYYTIVI